jgi:hypothetical protein
MKYCGGDGGNEVVVVTVCGGGGGGGSIVTCLQARASTACFVTSATGNLDHPSQGLHQSKVHAETSCISYDRDQAYNIRGRNLFLAVLPLLARYLLR